MALIFGIETSCDESAAALYDSTAEKIISHALFSQIAIQEKFGGVVPEIASRSQLEKIMPIIRTALTEGAVDFSDVDIIAVTSKPGLVGSLLVGICTAKALAFAGKKKLIGVDHLEGHIFSAFLKADGSINHDLAFPHLCLSVSGGHTTLYLVHDFGNYEILGGTIDDAAGEAFDKVAFMMGHGYPGGPIIEELAARVLYNDFRSYPRGKKDPTSFNVSFSGLKTAVLYDLIKQGAFDLKTGMNKEAMTQRLQQEVASSLLVCITEIFEHKIRAAFKQYPLAKGLTFVGGVAANSFMKERFAGLCNRREKFFFAPPRKFCTDNAAMIAFVASKKAEKNMFSSLELDVFE